MRTADELIRAANMTGTYQNYVGDGATIPWEDVIFPADYVLYTYKLYLDRNWPEAFRLHDWCYTPLGQLIQVMRLEADSALSEIIARDSVPDARIVFAAVRLGGGQYFGLSMTGINAANMGPASPSFRSSPMPIKVVMKFRAATSGPGGVARVAGFSESVWFLSDDVAACLVACRTASGGLGLLPARAGLLPSQAAIVELKLYQGGAGRGQSFAVNYPGQRGPTDLPNMALLASTFDPLTGKTRRWFIHCVPDQYVVTGEYAPDQAMRDAVDNYFRLLNLFGFFTAIPSPATAKITTIVSIPPVAPATIPTALVNLEAIDGITAGMTVNFSGVKLDNGNPIAPRPANVQSITGANQFLLPTWTFGNAKEGTVSQSAYQASQFSAANCQIVRAATRKVGRPSGGFVGRASKRR